MCPKQEGGGTGSRCDGVGHLHAHRPVSNGRSGIPDEPRNIDDDQNADREPDDVSEHSSNIDGASSDAYNSDNSELDLDNRDFEGWEDGETDSGNDFDCRSDAESENSDEDVGM